MKKSRAIMINKDINIIDCFVNFTDVTFLDKFMRCGKNASLIIDNINKVINNKKIIVFVGFFGFFGKLAFGIRSKGIFGM